MLTTQLKATQGCNQKKNLFAVDIKSVWIIIRPLLLYQVFNMPKTTFKIRVKLWELFNRECQAMSIRRDNFLNNALHGEIALFAQIKPCDSDGERWVKKMWVEHGDSKDCELRLAPVLLSDEVIEQINTTCLAKRVPRDAFMDCALTFLVQRLYEPALVIKNPRTTKDVSAQIAQVLNDDHEDADRERLVSEVAQEFLDSRKTKLLDPGYDIYKDRLSFDADRVAQEKLMLESYSWL